MQTKVKFLKCQKYPDVILIQKKIPVYILPVYLAYCVPQCKVLERSQNTAISEKADSNTVELLSQLKALVRFPICAQFIQIMAVWKFVVMFLEL